MHSPPQTDTGVAAGWRVTPLVHRTTPYSQLGEHGPAGLLQAPQILTLQAEPSDEHHEVRRVVIEARLVNGRYRIGRFEVTGRAEGVSPEAIRRVPVGALLREAAANTVHIVGWLNEDGEEQDWVWTDPMSDPDTALDIVFYIARAIGEPTNRAIAEHFGISPTAAAGRVRRRRAAGRLPETTRGMVS